MANVQIRIRRTHVVDFGEHEFITEFAPCDWKEPLLHIEGDKAVLAYLVHDQSPPNPMKECDAQGTLYTSSHASGRGGSITDDDTELRYALGLDSYGCIDPDKKVTVGGVKLDYAQHVNDELFDALDIDDVAAQLLWLHRLSYTDLNESEFEQLENIATVDGPHDLAYFKATYEDVIRKDLLDPNGHFSERLEQAIDKFYAKHWREIVGPEVVIVNYRHYQDTAISVGTWDGDTDELPDGVWVADKNVLANLPPTDDPTFNEKILAYAKSVLDEYESWCNGDCYGCVVQLYKRVDNVWVAEDDHDSCWGFIGDYADQALREEFFEAAVKRLQNEVTN